MVVFSETIGQMCVDARKKKYKEQSKDQAKIVNLDDNTEMHELNSSTSEPCTIKSID